MFCLGAKKIAETILMKVKENCVITYFVRPCLSYMYLPLTYVRFSELRSSQKTFHDVYE